MALEFEGTVATSWMASPGEQAFLESSNKARRMLPVILSDRGANLVSTALVSVSGSFVIETGASTPKEKEAELEPRSLVTVNTYVLWALTLVGTPPIAPFPWFRLRPSGRSGVME